LVLVKLLDARPRPGGDCRTHREPLLARGREGGARLRQDPAAADESLA